MYLSTRLTADANLVVDMAGFVITSSKQMVTSDM